MAPGGISVQTINRDAPNWEPLLDLASACVEDFMWMFEIELEGGTRIQAYKHWWTRRYLYLACDGRGFRLCGDGRYREADARRMLDLALA